MTNEQKAVKIATRDGYVTKDNMYWSKTPNIHVDSCVLELNYLTDLNYLVPVAVKVYKLLLLMIFGIGCTMPIQDLPKHPKAHTNPYLMQFMMHVFTLKIRTHEQHRL